MIVDASVILRAFFPDEAQEKAQALIRDHISRRVALRAPSLLPYELSNAVWQAERRKRISREQADQILQSMSGLEVEILPLEWSESLPLARQFNCSVYDASYLALAERLGEPFVTCDERLYNAVHTQLSWVNWLEDYTSMGKSSSRLGEAV